MILDTGVIDEIFSSPGPWHYAQVDQYIKTHDVVDWCLDNFGIDGLHNWVVNVSKEVYFFKSKDDLILFILRWS